MNPENQPQAQIEQNNDAVQTLIPYKNMPALLAYYFGVFGLIPFLGLPLSVAAVILGIIGLQKSNKSPQLKGKGHAIAGIVLGSIELIIFLLFFIFAFLTGGTE